MVRMVMVFILLCGLCGFAAGPVQAGDVFTDKFGVNLQIDTTNGQIDQYQQQTTYHFVYNSYTPTNTAVSYKVNDWFGSWSSSNFNQCTS